MTDEELERRIDAALSDPKLHDVDMGDLGEVRGLLGEYGAALSDAEVARIRDLSLGIGDAMFHWWLRRRQELAKAPPVEDTDCEGVDLPSPP